MPPCAKRSELLLLRSISFHRSLQNDTKKTCPPAGECKLESLPRPSHHIPMHQSYPCKPCDCTIRLASRPMIKCMTVHGSPGALTQKDDPGYQQALEHDYPSGACQGMRVCFIVNPRGSQPPSGVFSYHAISLSILTLQG